MLNKITVIGNVGRDPEMRYTPSGSPVTSFSLATNRNYTTADGERHEETEWFRVVAWNRLAEQCNQYVTRGMRVYAEGRLKSDTWTDREGQTRFTNEIIAFTVLFLDRAQQRGAYEDGAPFAAEAGAGGEDADELPW